MLEIDRALEAKLRQHRVQVRAADLNTIVLRNVPANERFFNKPRTNVLVKRPQEGMPFLVCVDEDLEYTGSDPSLARAFAGGARQEGWRVIFVDPRERADPQQVVEDALGAIGFDGVEPSLKPLSPRPPSPPASVLARFGMVLSAGAPGEREREQTVGRSDEIAEVLGGVLQWRPRLPVVVAESGAGKTHLLRALGREVARRRPGTRLVKVDLGELFTGTVFDAEREKLLAAVLDEAAFELDILALERLDLALAEAPHGPLRLARAIDGGSRVIGTTLPEALSRFDGTPLTRHLHTVGLEPLTARETLEAVRGVIGAIAAHHQVRIDESLAQAVVERAATLAGCFPAKAIALIDAAGARAHLVGAPSVDLSHVYVAACGFKEVEE